MPISVPCKASPPVVFFFLLLSSLFISPSSSVSAQIKVLDLNPDHRQYQLGSYFQIFEDSSGQLTIEDVSSPEFSDKFVTNDSASINKGFSEAVLWIRFSLQSTVDTQSKDPVVGNAVNAAEWLLHFGKHLDYYDEIDVYWQETAKIGQTSAGWQKKRYGMYQAVADGVRNPQCIRIVVDKNASQALNVYLRVNIESGFFIDPTLYSPGAYEQFSKKLSIFYGSYYGLVLAMIVYNLFLFFFLNDKVRLLFIAYALTLCCYFVLANELAFPLISTNYLIATRKAAQFLTLFSIIQMLYFSTVFLETKKNCLLFHRLMQLEMVIAFALMLAMFFVSYFGLVNLVVNFATLSFLSIMLTGIAAWYAGYRPARFFVLAWIFFISGGLVYTCTFSGIFPYPFIGNNAAQAGSAMEMLLLSLALADRMKYLFEGLQQRMSRREKQLHGLTQQLVQTEERERRRMAGILHDSIGQILVATKWEVKRLLKVSDGPVQKESPALEYIDSCIAETRSLTTELYPRVLYQIGLNAGLELLAEEFSNRFDLRVKCHYTGEPGRASEEQRLILYRSVSELLNNTVKHAKADKVTIELLCGEEIISVVVQDDGIGSDYTIEESSENDGFGLFSIRERLQRLGGSLVFQSPESGGLRVTLQLPLDGITIHSQAVNGVAE